MADRSRPTNTGGQPCTRTIRAVDDPVTLSRAARIVRAALARRTAPTDADLKSVPDQERDSVPSAELAEALDLDTTELGQQMRDGDESDPSLRPAAKQAHAQGSPRSR
jgi:hypothetical protein